MMRFVVFLATLVTATTPAVAYEIEDLVREARSYHDGLMQQVGDLTVEHEGVFHAQGDAGLRSTTYRKGALWRTDATMKTGQDESGAVETIALFDGTDTWSVAMGMKTKLPPGTLQSTSSVPAYWVEPAAGSRIVGEETVAGRACWIVEGPSAGAALAGMGPTRTWIDKQGFVLVKSEASLSGKTVVSTFSDFRTVHGDFEVPYLVEVTSDGKKSMTARIVRLEIGTGLSDELFDPATIGGRATTLDVDALTKKAEEMRKKMEEKYGAKK